MAQNVYDVHMQGGRTYEVATPHHHDDHDDETFKKHLLDVAKNSIGNLVSEVIIRLVYKGKRH